ncbi:MAG TPA: flavodoxin family protein [Thermoguttaceae bacterium]|nr:flavodoxin family protein [Thermoguttaceae bacterium]
MPSELTRRKFLGTAGTVAAGAGASVALAADSAEPSAEKSVKILGICCSPRKGQTTATALKICLMAAEEAGVEIEMIELAGMQIPGEPAAGVPLAPGQQDDFPQLVPKISDPKVAGLIIGTPVYFGNMSFLCKALLDRFMAFRKDFALSDKVAGVVAVGGGRNGGQELTIRSVHTCLMGQGMIIVGDGPPTGHWGGTVWGGAPGGVTEDEFGLSTARNLGRHVAEVALKMHG